MNVILIPERRRVSDALLKVQESIHVSLCPHVTIFWRTVRHYPDTTDSRRRPEAETQRAPRASLSPVQILIRASASRYYLTLTDRTDREPALQILHMDRTNAHDSLNHIIQVLCGVWVCLELVCWQLTVDGGGFVHVDASRFSCAKRVQDVRSGIFKIKAWTMT